MTAFLLSTMRHFPSFPRKRESMRPRSMLHCLLTGLGHDGGHVRMRAMFRTSGLMPGLDPGIHSEVPPALPTHAVSGLPGRSPAVSRRSAQGHTQIPGSCPGLSRASMRRCHLLRRRMPLWTAGTGPAVSRRGRRVRIAFLPFVPLFSPLFPRKRESMRPCGMLRRMWTGRGLDGEGARGRAPFRIPRLMPGPVPGIHGKVPSAPPAHAALGLSGWCPAVSRRGKGVLSVIPGGTGRAVS